MSKGVVTKIYKKGALVRKMGFAEVRDPETNELMERVPVFGQAGIINMNVDSLVEGAILDNIHFTNDGVLTPAGIAKQQAREELSAGDYIPGLVKVIGG